MKRRTALTRLGGTALTLTIGIPSVASAGPGKGKGKGDNNGKGNGSADVVVPDDYSTIQAAVDAADSGDTVLVDGGTYVEEVLIEKGLTLRGQDGATVKAPSSPSEEGIVRAKGDIKVDIESLTIDGAGNKPPASDYNGILYDGARGTITDNTVKRVREDPLAGYQSGTGISITDSDNIKIRDNEVSDYQKTGILVSGEETKADVRENTVTGPGVQGTIAPNGIDMDFASGIIQENVVSDHGYDAGGPVVGAGIITSPSDNIKIQKNTLENNEAGIFPIGDGNKVQNNEISNGRANGSKEGDWAIIFFGDNNKAVNNTITNYETGGYLFGDNNKFINNKLEDVDTKVTDAGDESKVEANREQA